MAIILSIETSTLTSSIAIHEDGRLISSQNIHLDKSHSEYLTPSIKYLFETSGLQLNAIDAVAISKGPGSYTGLRIGTSTAKGICYALDSKLIAVNSLEAMAYGMAKYQFEDVLLCPMIDARRMEVYCLIAKNDLSIVEKTQAKIIDESSFSNLLSDSKIIFFGNGAIKCKSVLDHSENAIFIKEIVPSADHIGVLAWKAYQQRIFENLAYFEPFYLKDFIAKKPSAKKMV
ncbi:MAG: tRNA (adenosine(37)-N6)-threonylcarbamoyltransferase complex dimerization subunit type 1 TsaB [Cyclobacteriaceae bacterium]|nr:tRNA (adenosine(37)-N6)-threonylcarbamoyltransferase complex dimerization subunit type 1 TsaB [Cyclobacteriaceae bacterium]